MTHDEATAADTPDGDYAAFRRGQVRTARDSTLHARGWVLGQRAMLYKIEHGMPLPQVDELTEEADQIDQAFREVAALDAAAGYTLTDWQTEHPDAFWHPPKWWHPSTNAAADDA